MKSDSRLAVLQRAVLQDDALLTDLLMCMYVRYKSRGRPGQMIMGWWDGEHVDLYAYPQQVEGYTAFKKWVLTDKTSWGIVGIRSLTEKKLVELMDADPEHAKVLVRELARVAGPRPGEASWER